MTAFDTLIGTLAQCTCVASDFYTTYTCTEDASFEERATTLACLITSSLSEIEISPQYAKVENAITYIESLSEEELERFDKLLQQKEIEIIGKQALETPKIYIKENNGQ